MLGASSFAGERPVIVSISMRMVTAGARLGKGIHEVVNAAGRDRSA